MDPIKIGRVRVRLFNYNTNNLQEIAVTDLPWFQTLSGVMSAGVSGVGASPSDLVEGSWVVGFFVDMNDKQRGFVLSSVQGIPLQAATQTFGFSDPRQPADMAKAPKTVTPSYNGVGSGTTYTETTNSAYPRVLDEPDTSRLSRNDQGLAPASVTNKTASRTASNSSVPAADGSTFSEPAIAYAAVYPYNKVKETESGHVMEFDDTLGAERVHIYHRTGSFVEFLPDGSIIAKAVNDRYELVYRNSFEHVDGSKSETIDQGYSLYVNRDNKSKGLTIVVGSGADVNVTVQGGNVNMTVQGNVTGTVSGNVLYNVTGDYTINARTINLNP